MLRGRVLGGWPASSPGHPLWWSRQSETTFGRQPADRHERSVDPVTTVLLTAILVVALLFAVVLGTVALTVRALLRRQLDDARAQARHWVERLGGELLVLDGAAVRAGATGPAGLAEAAERFTAASAEFGAARTRRQCRLAQQTAIEGLHHVRTARKMLRLDAGPRVPGQGMAGTLRTVMADRTSLPKLVDVVLPQGHGPVRQLPAGVPALAAGFWQAQQRRAHGRVAADVASGQRYRR